jgi:malonyl-CoA/methylmalonyl-CoA synthetase
VTDVRARVAAGDTGDVVEVAGAPYFRVLGRTSVDIIKCGGFKLSALRVENVLLDHPAIREVAVFGLEDDVYGEVVAVVAAPEEGASLTLGEVISWGTERLTLHELPRDLHVVPAIERNAMGKVNKKALKALFGRGGQEGAGRASTLPF